MNKRRDCLDEVELHLDDMIEKIMQAAVNQSRTFQLNVELEIARLPQHIREMNLGTFLDSFNGEVFKPEQSHTLKIQKDIDNWVESTPKLRRRVPLADTTNVSSSVKSAIRKTIAKENFYETPKRVTRSQSLSGEDNENTVIEKVLKPKTKQNAAIKRTTRKAAAKLKEAAMLLE